MFIELTDADNGGKITVNPMQIVAIVPADGARHTFVYLNVLGTSGPDGPVHTWQFPTTETASEIRLLTTECHKEMHRNFMDDAEKHCSHRPCYWPFGRKAKGATHVN